MGNTGIIGIILILGNVIFSYKGFNDRLFFDANKFEINSILNKREYKRLIYSGFLHADWSHLIFNMISLYAFCGYVEAHLGSLSFLIIYFGSLLGGDVLALFVHKKEYYYSAVGASGAVCGVIFASIALFPGIEIGILFLPFPMPSWLFGILYVAYSIYGIKSSHNNIGHEAHLGGALVGMLLAVIINPTCFANNYLTILLISIPILIFIILIISKPEILRLKK